MLHAGKIMSCSSESEERRKATSFFPQVLAIPERGKQSGVCLQNVESVHIIYADPESVI